MTTPDLITYIKEAEEIEEMYMDLLESTTQKRMRHTDDGSTGLQNAQYKVCVINSSSEPLQRALLIKYGVWYEVCRRLALEYPVRGSNVKYEAFTGLHEKILSLIDLKDPATNSNEKKHLKDGFLSSFDAQVNMLYTIEPLIASAKDSYRKMITADLVNSALNEAENLHQQGLVSAAGIMAGFALERYLKMLCEVNGVELGTDATMVTMARKLLASDELYGVDSELLGSVDRLAHIRDKCISPHEEPKEQEVRELIDRAREIIFLAFC